MCCWPTKASWWRTPGSRPRSASRRRHATIWPRCSRSREKCSQVRSPRSGKNRSSRRGRCRCGSRSGCARGGRMRAARWRGCDRRHLLAPNPLSSSPDSLLSCRSNGFAPYLQSSLSPGSRSVLHRKLALIAVALTALPAAVAAQGSFGSDLAVSGREVFVGQPGNSYGPGVVYLFRPDAQGAWGGRAAKKITRADASNDDGFGSAIAVDGNTLLVG